MPERTCVLSRQKDEKEKFIRFVLAPGLLKRIEQVSLRQALSEKGRRPIQIDLFGTASGRGAYCQADIACLLNGDLPNRLLFSLLNERLKSQAADFRWLKRNRSFEWTMKDVFDELIETCQERVLRKYQEQNLQMIQAARAKLLALYESKATKKQIRL